jgi:hypothetical protein
MAVSPSARPSWHGHAGMRCSCARHTRQRSGRPL